MTGNAVNHGKCLTDESLTDYLEGGLDPALKVASEVHLVGCDVCRVRLAFFMKLLKEDVAPEEAVAVRAIQAEWMKVQTDRRLPNKKAAGRNRWRMASGGLAAALLITVGTRVAFEYKGEPKTADEVIHLLLAENRFFEARISDQPHLPYTATRGPNETGNYNLLAGQMSRLAATTYEMGLFHMLQGNFSSAITYLELAARETGAPAEVHNDLGVAYLESRIEADQQKAVSEFRRALAAKPGFLPAAYNLALAYERLGQNEPAETQWMQYLQLESDHAWKDEAKAKLEGIKH